MMVKSKRSVVQRAWRSGLFRASALSKNTRELPHLASALRSNSCAYYQGWLGHGNLGDEAIFEAYSKALPELHLVHFPLGRPSALAKALLGRPRVDTIFLGGGTLIGQEGHREALETLFRRYPNVPAFMLGPGVEDPRLYDKKERIHRELHAWVKPLSRFHRVTVRGPRSQEILRKLDIEATVVGDPALLHADGSADNGFRERLLGINVGWSPRMWGDSQAPMLEVLIALCRDLARSGWRFRLVPFGPRDLTTTQTLSSSLGASAETFVGFDDTRATLAAIRECHAFIGQKLHSVVLASAVYVPSLMLEYRPKCLDFQSSIDREYYTIRTDRLNLEELRLKLDDLIQHRDEHRAKIKEKVNQLRSRLAAYLREIRAELKL